MVFQKSNKIVLLADSQGRKVAIAGVSSDTALLIEKFVHYCRVEKEQPPKTIETTLYALARFLKYIKGKPLMQLTKEDIKAVIEKINDEPISGHYKVHIKAAVKSAWRFWKTTTMNDYIGDHSYPPEVSWISTNLKKRDKKKLTPGMFLNEDDVFKIVDSLPPTETRNKLIALLLFECCARAQEFCNIRICDADLRKDPVILTLHSTKKGGDRKIPIVISAPALKSFIEGMLASGHARNEFLFQPKENWNGVKVKDGRPNQLNRSGLTMILENICVNAGLVKRIPGSHGKRGKIVSKERLYNPHAWRKAGITRAVAVLRLSEPELRKYADWEPDSTMSSEYVFESAQDLIRAVMKGNGIETPEELEKPSKLKPITCPRCREPNQSTNAWCGRCGMALDRDVAASQELASELVAELMKDPERIDKLVKLKQKRELEITKARR